VPVPLAEWILRKQEQLKSSVPDINKLGKIFVLDVHFALDIRTNTTGESAL